MDQLSAIAAAAAAERAERNRAYDGLLAFSALPNAPVLGALPSRWSRLRTRVRRPNG
jgi:hypothetical protein